MLFGSVAIGGNGFAEVFETFSLKASAYSTGDYIYYGTYPQSEVTDSALVSALNGASGSWKSYGYYSGTGDLDDGQMKPSDYMRYKDVSYNGSKYRAVTFDSYRPYYTGYTSSASKTYQENNGYTTGNVYWFKYEPIKWRVLDPSTGLIMCDIAIDSQAYNNYSYYNGSEEYGDSSCTYYASNYAKSSIRAWLNNDFYNTAFSSDQKSNIVSTTLDNSSTRSSAYDAPSTTDKIFLLSDNDSINSNYGFNSSYSTDDTARQLKSTDYAKCQGCCQETSDSYRGDCWWWLRSPDYSNDARAIRNDGYSYDGNGVSSTYIGVVPALRLSNLKSDYAGSEIGSGDYIYYGAYPQTDVTDSLGTVLNNQPGTWVSYNYYSGSGSDGSMKPSNYMRYKDVSYNGEKYRAITFDTYRPSSTEDATSTSCGTYQDDNGYYYGNVYWFKYEPIKWRILDPSTGLIMCDTILDSQAYNNYILSSGRDEYGYIAYWGDSAKNYYANNYAKSSIREWLNKDFYNTAFSFSQQSNILYTTLNNSAYSTSCSACDSESTTDKVFLLSYDDVLNSKYGFATSTETYDSARQLKGSDYAKSQGLFVCKSSGGSYDGCSSWRLRSPGYRSIYTCGVKYDGGGDYIYGPSYTFGGVVPALRLQNLISDYAGSETEDNNLGLLYCTPKKGSLSVSAQDKIALQFDRDINSKLNLKTGQYIAVKNYNTDEALFVITDDRYNSKISISGNTLILSDFLHYIVPGEKYYLYISPGVVTAKNDSSVSYNGITSKDEYTFYCYGSAKEGRSLDVYSSKAVLNLDVGEEITVSALLTNNGKTVKQENTSFSIADNNVAEITNMSASDDAIKAVIKGKRPGITTITVVDDVWNLVKTFCITVRNEAEVYYISDLVGKETYASGVYITNVSHTGKDDGSDDVSFTAYNMLNCLSVVDVYDQYGNIIDCKVIKAFDRDYPTDIFSHLKESYYILKDIVNDFEYFTSNHPDSLSEKTKVSFNVPAGGYFTVTNSINASKTCLWNNIISLVIEATFSACGIADTNYESKAEIIKKVTKEIDYKKLTASTISKLLEKCAKTIIKGQGTLTAEYCSEISEELLVNVKAIFDTIGKDFFQVLKDAAKDVLPKTAIQIITTLSWDQLGGNLVDTYFYGPIKLAKYHDMYVTIADCADNQPFYVYNAQASNKRITNGIEMVASDFSDDELIAHAIQITSGEVVDYFNNVSGTNEESTIYSIRLIKKNKSVQPGSPVTVYIPIPEGYNPEDISVYHIPTDNINNRESINFTVENGYIKFVTTGFSYFVITTGKGNFELNSYIKRFVSDLTVDYKSSVILHANFDNIKGENITWYVNGNVFAHGDSIMLDTLTKDSNAYCEGVDSNGKVYKSDVENIHVRTSFWIRLKAFFKSLFGLLPIIDQK